MIVEDHPLNLELVVDLLEAAGYTILQAESGVGLLERVKREQPALILLDVQLPQLDGLTLLRQLKAEPATADIPVVVTTAYTQPAEEARALAAGCAEYLTKPLDTQALLQTVGRLLSQQ